MRLLNFIRFMIRAAASYRRAGVTGQVNYYAVLSPYGVPVATCLVARGRESWRLSNLATEAFEWKELK